MINPTPIVITIVIATMLLPFLIVSKQLIKIMSFKKSKKIEHQSIQNIEDRKFLADLENTALKYLGFAVVSIILGFIFIVIMLFYLDEKGLI